MTQTVTLEMPGDLVQRARAVAERTSRRFEDVLVGWISPEAPGYVWRTSAAAPETMAADWDVPLPRK